MANIHDCLDRAVAGGELPKAHAAAAKSEFDQLVARYETIMPRHQAEARAARDLKEATKRGRRARRHAVLNQLQAMARIEAFMKEAPDLVSAVQSLVFHVEGGGFTGESVYSVAQALRRSVAGNLAEVVKEINQTMIGTTRRQILMNEVVRELSGEATGSAEAKRFAQIVQGQYERLRQMFNAHGGDIGKLEDFGLPHSHDRQRLKSAGFDAWADAIRDRLDWSRIVDRATDQPFAAKGATPPKEVADGFLQEIYENIMSRGVSRRDPSMSVGGKALYNRRADPRILHFKSGSDWLDYNRQFGQTDAFSAMIGGLNGLALDVAQMRVLGPNPRLGLEYAIQVAEKRAVDAGDQKLAEAVKRRGNRARGTLAEIDGSASMAHNEAIARFGSGTRAVLTSAQLGSAVLSAVTDIGTMRMAAKAIGMNPNNVTARSMQLMASQATRETAAQMGIVADTLVDTGSALLRYQGEVVMADIPNRLAAFTLRASGLNFWTDMNRTAFIMETYGLLGQYADRPLSEVDPAVRNVLESRGITSTDWDLLREPEFLFDANGSKFMSPNHWLASQTALPRAEAEGLATRLQAIIEEQLEYAVPTNNPEARAMFGNAAPRGTLQGEFWLSAVMYKSYALSLTMGQIRRFMAIPRTMDRLRYMAEFSVAMTLLGATALQLKVLAKGEDPRPMDDAKFWGAAALQGGGLGIFGDFLASETNRFGGGLAETFAGPVAGLGSDVGGLVVSNATRAVNGETTFVGRDATNLYRYNMPVSSVWYLRPFHNAVADVMQEYLDPEAEEQWRRQARRQAREYRTGRWWSRAEFMPERAPDFSNALGDLR